MSEIKTLLKWGLVAGAIYGAYKLGQMSKESSNVSDSNSNSELDEVESAINDLKSKPNKTMKDKDVLDLLKIKLKQLTK